MKIYEPDNVYVKVLNKDVKNDVTYYGWYHDSSKKTDHFFPGKVVNNIFIPENTPPTNYTNWRQTVYRLKQDVIYEIKLKNQKYLERIEINKTKIEELKHRISELQEHNFSSGGRKYNQTRKNISRKFAYKNVRKLNH